MGRLVLLQKPKKSTDSEQTYRPICLLNEMKKLYERIVNKKLQGGIERKGKLADRPTARFPKGKVHGRCFRQGAGDRQTCKLRRFDFCLLITVDVRNIFLGSLKGDY